MSEDKFDFPYRRIYDRDHFSDAAQTALQRHMAATTNALLERAKLTVTVPVRPWIPRWTRRILPSLWRHEALTVRYAPARDLSIDDLHRVRDLFTRTAGEDNGNTET